MLASHLIGALKLLLQPYSSSKFTELDAPADKLKTKNWKITQITPDAHSLYEFLVFSTIAIEDVLLGNFLIDLFELLTIHLDAMLSLLQSFKNVERTQISRHQRLEYNQHNYLENTPIRLRQSMVTGLVIHDH